MKRSINGILYDTEAKGTEQVFEVSVGYAGDFRAFVETLHLTKNGRHFISGEGGPMTKWARPVGTDGSKSGGCGIQPCDPGEALAWLEANDAPVSVIAAHFDLEEA